MNSEIFSGLVGFAMPYVVELLKAKLPKTKGKWLGYVLSYGVCLLVGGIGAFIEGNFDGENVLSSAGMAMIASQGLYNLYFKPKKIDKQIERKFR